MIITGKPNSQLIYENILIFRIANKYYHSYHFKASHLIFFNREKNELF
jgi:hypothetical protein